MLAALVPSVALASVGDENEEPLIFGGTEVAACAWPTTVSVGGGCTGTLVHPQLVFYAGHCGAEQDTISMGEVISPQHQREIPTEFCMTNPDWDAHPNLGEGIDFAFCKLAEPVTDVPIVPVLMGCETEFLQVGKTVTIVGYGTADNGPYGTKREVEVPIHKVGVEAWVGGEGKASCQGDSGGPLYIQLSEDEGGDGTWRVFGVTSWGYAEACEVGGSFGLMHNAVEWVEEASGLDITPCHDADGTWHPGPDCRDFPREPGLSHGDWETGCGGGPVGDWSATCGQNPAGDDEAPTVAITAPSSGSRFDSDPDTGRAQLEIAADADDVGWGIKEVRLLIDGEEVQDAVDATAPYGWPKSLGPGQYVLVARAIDLGDNVTDSEPVYVGVDMDAPDPDGGDTGDTGETGTGDGEGGAAEDGGGCGCATRSGENGLVGTLALLGLLGLRRRRGRIGGCAPASQLVIVSALAGLGACESETEDPRLFGEPCKVDAECFSGNCVYGPDDTGTCGRMPMDGDEESGATENECVYHSDCPEGFACAARDGTTNCTPVGTREPCSSGQDCVVLGTTCSDWMVTDAGNFFVCECNPAKNGACTNLEGECFDARASCIAGCESDSACEEGCVADYVICLDGD